ncbi:uncharacterized protein [Ptychodera flava]|uniref:uncharacterized protein n=1 Tax=Ptychodera flava TaxID=63121 RepID=UPI00396A8A05
MAGLGGGAGGGSPDPGGSCASSMVGLTPIHLNGDARVPEQWQLVTEWNMERRQQRDINPYENWKFDVQSQIANMGYKLQKSLEEHPTFGGSSQSSYESAANDFHRRKDTMVKQQTSTVANSLAYGLGRT